MKKIIKKAAPKKAIKKVVISTHKKPKFEELTKAKQRVAIAKDIISAIKTEKYIANSGSYVSDFNFEGNIKYSYSDSIIDLDIKKILPKIKKCSVCALGACILSITKYKNKLKFKDIGGSRGDFTEKSLDLLSSVFTPKQLCIIESIFEKSTDKATSNIGRDSLGAVLTSGEIDACWNFIYLNEFDSEARLLSIMKHIISNKGNISANTLKRAVKINQ